MTGALGYFNQMTEGNQFVAIYKDKAGWFYITNDPDTLKPEERLIKIWDNRRNY